MMVVMNVRTTKVAEICSKVGDVNIAVHSSPVSCTISGDITQVEAVKAAISEDAKKTNEIRLFYDLKVDCAYHSHNVEHAARCIKECLEGIKRKTPNIPIFSTVTGGITDDFGTPEYWQQNVARPVLFYQALQQATNEKPTLFLEIGPNPVLKTHLRNIFTEEDVIAIPSMKLGNDSSQVRTTLGDLYALGINPRWQNIVQKKNMTDLPHYQFDGKYLMVESDNRFLRKLGLTDDFSGRYLMLTQKEKKGEFKVNFSPDTTPFVYDHVIDNAVIIPGAVYTEVAFELGMNLMGIAAESMIVEYEIIKAIPLSKGKPTSLDMTTSIKKTEDGLMNISFSITKDVITVAKGSVTNRYLAHKHTVPIEDVYLRTGIQMKREELYSELAKHGYNYGTSVQVLESITFEEDECTGIMQFTEEVARQINQTSFHPAILDAMLHSSALNFLSKKKESSCKIYPIRFGSVSVFRPFERRMICYTQTIQKVYDRSITNIILTRLDGLVLAEIKEIEHKIMDGSIGVNALAYQIIWTAEDMSTLSYESSDEPEPKVTICSDNNNVRNILRTIYPQGESYRLHDLVENHEAVISAGSKEMDMMIFVPISNFCQQSKNGDDLFHNVCENCEAFLNIMKILKDMDKTIIIVTENTQALGSETNSIRNVFGAELWGFSRSLRQEGTKCRMVLIDVQPSVASEVKTLHRIIQSLTSNPAFLLTECLIVDGQVYSNFLQQRPQSGLQNKHRVLSTDTNLDFQLRSITSDRIESPFLIPGDRSRKSRKNEVNLLVDEICIHSLNEFRVTELDSSLSKSLWSNYKDGYLVIGLEFLGTQHIKNRSRRVVACYPTNVAKWISVPEQCVCDRESLPMYTPGLIITSMLMWYIAQRIRRKSIVCILTESIQADDAAVNLLRDILKTVKNSKVIVASINALNGKNEFDSNVFVLLEKYSKTKITHILRPGNTIVGYDDVMSCLSNHVFQLNSDLIKVQVVQRMNVFEENNLVIAFPKVTRWLKRRQGRTGLSANAYGSSQLQTIKLTNPKSGEKWSIDTKASTDRIIHNNATYVVVGGLTGLGWEIVKWLGCKGAGVVVPLSRKGNNQQMQHQLQNAMDLHKYKIVPMRCNVTNYTDVETTFSNIKLQFPNHQIKGIFQGAGVLRDTRIESMTMENFKEVLQPKVLGTWNLHLASKELLLDFFVMHSSTTSVFGNAGQTNYGAANSFMDSLASYRRSINLPGQSINWGALAVGMASDETVRNNLEVQGYYVLEKDKIRECLMDFLIQNPCQVIYGLFDWKVIEKNPAMMRFSVFEREEAAVVSHLPGKRRIVNAVFSNAEFVQTSFQDQRQTLAKLLFSSISRVLSIEEKELEEKQNLISQGMESQKAVELIQVINETTGCRLPVAYILSPEYTIGMLIDFTHSNIIENINRDVTGISEVREDVNGTLSWMQKFYIDMQENNPRDSSLWFSVDFKLGSGLSNTKMWRTVLRWITTRNPELRTVYQHTNQHIRFGLKKTVLDPEDSKIDLRVVDSCEISKEWTDKDIGKYCLFDITTDPPIRVLYNNTGSKHRIRFIMSHITFDLQSFFTLLPQLKSDLRSYILKEEICVEPLQVPDLSVLMDEQLEAERFYLEEFWKGEIRKMHSLPSLDGSGKHVMISQKTEKVSLRLPRELADQVNTNECGVTPSALLFSLYQILLHRMMCVSVVPVVLTIDMRRHFPVFNDRICLGANYIPIITEFNDVSITLRNCILMCSNQVTLTTANSLYPFLLIKQMYADSHILFRHFFNVRDIPNQGTRNARLANYYMDHVGYNTDFLNQIETALNIVTDHKAGSIDFVLSFDPEIVSVSTAKNMLDDLLLLACLSVANPDFQLNEIPLLCCLFDGSDKMDQLLSTVSFWKETSNGWEHPVKLKVCHVDKIPQIAWSDSDSCGTSLHRNIPIPCVLSVDIGKVRDSWCLIIQTFKRQYCFKACDCFMVQAWRARIKKLISKSKQNM